MAAIETASRRWMRFKRRRLGVAALVVVAVYFAIALFVSAYGVYANNSGKQPFWEYENPDKSYVAPCSEYWLGTDYRGRSVLARAVAGTSTALKVGIISGLIAAFVGTTLGIWAGSRGGWCDDVVVWLYSTFASMPTLLFILAIGLLVSRDFLSPSLLKLFKKATGGSDPGLLAVYIAIGLTGWVTLCRVVRAETMKLQRASFVSAARVAGVSESAIMFRHLLPNVFHLVIIYFTVNCAGAIMLEVIVSYLGFGVQQAPSWGIMISDGQERLWRGVWWELAGATGFMFILVLALNILGDVLRDVLDPFDR
jgi:peptide/nickel transport system permease protein